MNFANEKQLHASQIMGLVLTVFLLSALVKIYSKNGEQEISI
jgi:hypothetical protein